MSGKLPRAPLEAHGHAPEVRCLGSLEDVDAGQIGGIVTCRLKACEPSVALASVSGLSTAIRVVLEFHIIIITDITNKVNLQCDMSGIKSNVALGHMEPHSLQFSFHPTSQMASLPAATHPDSSIREGEAVSINQKLCCGRQALDFESMPLA
ncbi:hypothetical protein MJT46_018851 [Ovis ammon polii x Ovis aries]|nr:hypothetical protein MJT46_018851 [Ovis ammon polii x Ovis aries]